MIGNNRHSDRTFVSEHICGRLAPSAGHAAALFLSLSRPPALTLARSLTPSRYLVPPLFPFFIAVPPRSRVRIRPIPRSLALSRRSFSFDASLSAALRNHPLRDSLGPRRTAVPCPPWRPASLHSSRSRASPLPIMPSLSLLPCGALYFSLHSLRLSLSPSLPLFLSSSLPLILSALPPPSSLSLSLLPPIPSRSRDSYVVVRHASARVCACTLLVLLARSLRANGRAYADRFNMRCEKRKEKNTGRMYRRRLSPRRVNTLRRMTGACAARALGQWRNFSRFFLLPFCIGPAFRIYLRVCPFHRLG